MTLKHVHDLIIYPMLKSFQKGKSSSMKPMLVEVLLLLIL